MRFDGDAILRPEHAEIKRGHDGGERGRGGLMTADLHAVVVVAEVVGVVNRPRREPENLLLQLGQYLQLLSARHEGTISRQPQEKSRFHTKPRSHKAAPRAV